MPTYAQIRRHRLGVSPGDLMMGRNATGSNYALDEVGISTFYGHPYLTEVVNPGSQEMLDEAGLVYKLAIEIPVEMLDMLGTGKGVIGMGWDAVIPGSEDVTWSLSHDYVGYGMGNLELSGQPVAVAAHSPVVGTQLDEIATSINSKLQERLTLFKAGRSNQEPVPEITMSQVEELVARLCGESNLVSSTVSADGMLTVAVDFPEDVRLYVEIERDGSAEAAVIKGKLDVSEIQGDTVAFLTSEVILAAVANI